MATTIAVVGDQGQLLISQEVSEQLHLQPGVRVAITIEQSPIQSNPFDKEAAAKAIEELRGAFAGQPSLDDEYFRTRDIDKW